MIESLMEQGMRLSGVCVLSLLMLLTACSQAPRVDLAPERVLQAQLLAERVQRLERLLTQAEQALINDRLQLPAADNAYDRYHAVLLLDPDNLTARTGLQLIVMRYIELGRASLGRGRIAQTERYWRAASSMGVGDELVQELREQIDQQLLLQSEKNSKKVVLVGSSSRVVLAPELLDSRSAALLKQLDSAAERIRNSQESLLIVARNDAEGRWLYKQIKVSLSGYRLRGDIRVGEQAYLEFQPSLD